MTAIGWGSAGRPGRHNGAVGVAGVRVKRAAQLLALVRRREAPGEPLVDVALLRQVREHCAPGKVISFAADVGLHSELAYLSPEEYEQVLYALPTGPPSGDAANKKMA